MIRDLYVDRNRDLYFLSIEHDNELEMYEVYCRNGDLKEVDWTFSLRDDEDCIFIRRLSLLEFTFRKVWKRFLKAKDKQ